jgi:hypothetical protein
VNGDRLKEGDPFRQIVYGIMAAATLAYAGWAGFQINSINDRLTRIETTMTENKQERQGQVDDIRRRLDRVEIRVYRGTASD